MSDLEELRERLDGIVPQREWWGREAKRIAAEQRRLMAAKDERHWKLLHQHAAACSRQYELSQECEALVEQIERLEARKQD